MSEKLTAEQRRIAELFGTVSVLETLLIDLVSRGQREGSLDDLALKKKLSDIIQESEEPQENEWGERGASAERATAIRIKACLQIGQQFAAAEKRATAGEA